MANYLTQIKSSSDTTYNIKDTEAITSIVINQNDSSTIAPVEDGVVTLDLSDYIVTEASSSRSGTIKVISNYQGQDTNLSLKDGYLMADVPIKNIVLQNGYWTTKLTPSSTGLLTIPNATKNDSGVVRIGDYVNLDAEGKLRLTLGESGSPINNILLEEKNLDYSNLNTEEEKTVKVSTNLQGISYISALTKECLFNNLKKLDTDYLSKNYLTIEEYNKLLDSLYSNEENKGKSIEELLSGANKISKHEINDLSELPDLIDPNDDEINSLYIYKSNEDIYVFTAKKVNNTYKWICIATPQNSYENEDIDFNTYFTKYDNYEKISESNSFYTFSSLKNYLDNIYSSNDKTVYLINGDAKEGIKTNLISNGNGAEYLNFDVIIAEGAYYFYAYEYSATNEPDIIVASDDNSVIYNGNDITAYLFKPEEDNE